MRTAPTWGDIEEFCLNDLWRRLPTGGRGPRHKKHIFYEKVLTDGTVLQTHISHSGKKTVSPGRFSATLHDQLKVTKEEFWRVIQTGEPSTRPYPVVEKPRDHAPWVVRVLRDELHMSTLEIEEFSEEEAKRKVHEHWSTPKRTED